MNPFHPFGDIIDPTTGQPVRILHQPRPIGITEDPPEAGKIFLAGPYSGPAQAPSNTFFLTPDMDWTGEVTMNDNDAGGTFTPETFTWENERHYQTFTYTAPAAGEFQINLTTNPSLETLPRTYIAATTGSSQTYSAAFAEVASDTAEITADQFDGAVPFSARNTCFQNWCLLNRYASSCEIGAMKAMLAIP